MISFKTFPGPDAGELIHITYQNQPGSHVDSSQKGVHQADIHHRHFINNDHVCIQGILFIPVKTHTRCGIAGGCVISGTGYPDGNQLQHAVNGSGLPAGSFGHALGCAAGRRSQKDFHALSLKITDDRVDRGGFSRTGTAGDD